jgi:hypothetical protein
MSVSFCVARSIALMAVETCSKAVLALFSGHGKSPCFLRCSFLKLFGVDGAVLVFASKNVGKFLECAF